MRRIHIVGRQNHGKTTLIVELLSEYARQGIVVGSIKHTGHSHELDTPGKDSYRHRQAGARPAAAITADLIGLWIPSAAIADPYALIAPMFSSCQLVLVEGDVETPAIKIEVWRESVGSPPLAATHKGIHAIVSDDAPPSALPVWPRREVSRLTRRIDSLLRGS
jgi:molybdopterin-guanine dinucleotide biosynthesis adapter protein